MEVMVAAALLILTIVGATNAMVTANRFAATARVLTEARAIVQRNIDTALTVAFTQATTPAILATTPASGQVWTDDGGYNPAIQISVTDVGGIVVALGTLTRTVTTVSNSDGAVILQVTFTLNYTYANRSQTVSMTTMRSRDD